MKFYKFSLVATILSLSAMASATANIISWAGANSFNTADGYTASGFLEGKAGWVTNDPYNSGTGAGDVGYTVYASGYTNPNQASGNLNVLFGGYDLGNGVVPSLVNSNYSHAAGVITDPNDPSMQVTWRFAIQPSSTVAGESTANDTFGFALQDPSGAEIVRIDFDTALAGSQVGGSDFDINWLVDGVTQTANSAMPELAGGFYSTVYDLRMNVQQSNTVTVDMRPVTISTGATGAWDRLVTNGELGAGLNVDSLGQVAFNWELAEGLANPGSNYMQVIDITVIPELSCSTALLGLGALAFAFRRRKR
jgi:hypothetical protein